MKINFFKEMSIKKISTIAASAIVLSSLIMCSSPSVNAKEGESVKSITISQAISDCAKSKCDVIELSGTFHGWNGGCPSSAMKTRSDWVIKDDSGCLFVAGAKPPGLSMQKPANEKVRVTGHIVAGEAGKFRFEATSVIIDE
jgi:hypothetical protein